MLTWIVRLGAELPFARAALWLGELSGVVVSAATVRRQTEAVGATVVAQAEAEVARLQQELPDPVMHPQRLELGADGVMVPLVAGEWAEAKLLSVGEPEPPGALGTAETAVRTVCPAYFARLPDAETFAVQALGESHRVGLDGAAAVATVQNGVPWLQGFVDYHRPDARRILDWPHAAEHLSALAEALCGVGTPRATRVGERLRRWLWEEGPERVLAILAGWQRARPDLASAVAYFRERQAQLDYPAFRAAGWPVGSGATESAHKQVMQARMKRAGMRLARPHVNPLLALTLLEHNDRWAGDGPLLVAAHRACRLAQRRSHQRSRQPVRHLIRWQHGRDGLAPLPPAPAVTARAQPQRSAPRLPASPTPHPWRRFGGSWLSAIKCRAPHGDQIGDCGGSCSSCGWHCGSRSGRLVHMAPTSKSTRTCACGGGKDNIHDTFCTSVAADPPSVFFAAGPQLVCPRVSAASSATPATSTRPGGRTQVAPVAAALAPTPAPIDAPGTAPYRAMLNALIPKYNGLLKYSYTLPTALGFDTTLKKSVEGHAVPVDAQGKLVGPPVICFILLNPIVDSFTLEQQQFVVAHELFHCYQAAIIGSVATVYAAPDWLLEGSAEWAGAVISGATSTVPELHIMWGWWLANPDMRLFKWTTPAIGFFSLLNQAGISPWKVLPAMLLSQTKGTVPDNEAAYQAGTTPAAQKVLDEWAASYERDISLGVDWDLTGPGILTPIMYGGPVIHDVTLGNGQSTPVTTPAYTALDDDVTAQADVVHVSISGTSRLHDSASFERVTSANGNYCTKQGGCTCPPGSASPGLTLLQLTGVLHLAVTGGQQGANGTVSGLTLEQFCSQKHKPTAVPPITVAFCQSFLTVSQANAIMQPLSPASTIRVDTSPAMSSCNYEYAHFRAVVSVLFLPYNAQESLDTIASQGVAQAQSEGATVTKTSVSGVGDQALYITGSIADPPYSADYLDATYGAVFFSCFVTFAGPPPAAQQAPLTQVCLRVVNVLDP